MIVIKDKYGQLCNRLWAYAPIISKVLETKEKIDILNFYDYYKYFENLEMFENVRFRKKSNFLHTLFIRMPEDIMWIFKPTRKEFWRFSRLDEIKFINSWAHKDICEKLNHKELKKLFLPKLTTVSKVDNLIKIKRKDYDFIIGVHLRKGDYETFRNGIFYYSDDEYSKVLLHLKSQFPEDKRIGFLLCSNSSVDLDKFRQLNIIQIESPDLMDDLYGLSLCDYIVGPPSTYSMWASYYGKKPLSFLMKKSEMPNLVDFSVIISENTFENGKKLDISGL